jgi:hypothetical protein
LSTALRFVPADGVWGGISPTADAIQIGFYHQYLPAPLATTHAINPDGTLARELARTMPSPSAEVVRRFEVGVVMDLPKAEEFLKWLDGQVKKLRGVAEQKK